jgi:tRNA 2-thiouridine synthesizing protein A
MDDDVERLDTCGLLCPLPVLRARKRLMTLPPGARLEVLADDPASAVDMPHFCAQAGHRLLAEAIDGEVRRFLIERGPDRAAG